MGSKEGLNDTLRHLAHRYTAIAEQILGDRLTTIALYGSVARGEARATSDIDLFIVLRDPPLGAFKRRLLLQLVRDDLIHELEQLWQQRVYTDFVEVIRSEAEAQLFHPLYLDMTTEAHLLYDRDGFLATILQRVRERLNTLGAQRRKLGTIVYWDLKPGLMPGEVIKL